MSLSRALFLSFKDLFKFKWGALLIFVPLLAMAFWVLMFSLYLWGPIFNYTQQVLSSEFFNLLLSYVSIQVDFLPKVIAFVLVLLLFLPLTFFTSLLFMSWFFLPYVVRNLQKKYYPNLPLVGASGIGSLYNSVAHGLFFIFLFIISLPLWLIPGFGLFIPLILGGLFNRKVLSYDALSEFLTHKQIKDFQKKHRADLLLMGIFISGLVYVPILGLISPYLGALAFTHFCLSHIKPDESK